MPGAFDRLAVRMRQMVRVEHLNAGSGAERFKVTSTGPLRFESLSGTLTLEDGDPDVTIGWAVRQYDLNYGLTIGDEVWALRESGEWHISDVTDPGGQVPFLHA